MLLIHQAGEVKVGEVIRYTVTYTPLDDRILPTPDELHVKIKNTSAIPLRAAYLHGPYTLHVSSCPSTFNPNKKMEDVDTYGSPNFEPNLKAAGQWTSTLAIPEYLRSKDGKVNTSLNADGSPQRITWIIDIASQIIFSGTASVNFELLVGRDERSLDMGFAGAAGKGHGGPGLLKDYQAWATSSPRPGHRRPQLKGVYSSAVQLVVEDTIALWDKPSLPRWVGTPPSPQPITAERGKSKASSNDLQAETSEKLQETRSRTRKKVHLVILTHGLHSNVGADMLYLKESIDATVKSAREEAKKRKQALHKRPEADQPHDESKDTEQPTSTAPLSGGQEDMSKETINEESDDEDDEQVIVRGFSGNIVRTERGIQYLGKRLAKFILTLTYPDQPYLPASKSISRSFSLGGSKKDQLGQPAHHGSSIHKVSATAAAEKLAYTFTKISFVGHSLGGLVQTYAIGYIQKHSPDFFQHIKPENFVAMASPFLGLSNENPIYVKFALDFGLVGRTGRDLGLTWRAPTLARSGWSAMVAGLGSNSNPSEKQSKEEDPRSKPLLRILPTGPAHQVLKMFKNRTVYSNVVNDGIVPLRTSCLLFLDWKGLEKVENTRRDNGLITTMAQFGWNELTGANASTLTSHRPSTARPEDDTPRSASPANAAVLPARTSGSDSTDFAKVAPSSPSPALDEVSAHQNLTDDGAKVPEEQERGRTKVPDEPDSPFSEILKFFRPGSSASKSPKPSRPSDKTIKPFRRAQTVRIDGNEVAEQQEMAAQNKQELRRGLARGESFESPPPTTTFFEAAGDILNPPLPTTEWLIDPSTRTRTIFHDRVYHSRDIPPPPTKRASRSQSTSVDNLRKPSAAGDKVGEEVGSMKIEEKIARAYHRDMSWRKVLVRLEPDAHNNMVVRRMFANANGWDVIKHLCDTHFANTFSSNTADEDESNVDRAALAENNVTEDGEEVQGQTSKHPPIEKKDGSETVDNVHGRSTSNSSLRTTSTWDKDDSVNWDEATFEGDTADESDGEAEGPFATFQKFWSFAPKHNRKQSQESHPEPLGLHTDLPAPASSSPKAKVAEELTRSPQPVDGHRGLGVVDEQVSSGVPADNSGVSDPITAEEARPDALPDTELPSTVNPTELGLGKPVEERTGIPPSPQLLKRTLSKN